MTPPLSRRGALIAGAAALAGGLAPAAGAEAALRLPMATRPRFSALSPSSAPGSA